MKYASKFIINFQDISHLYTVKPDETGILSILISISSPQFFP